MIYNYYMFVDRSVLLSFLILFIFLIIYFLRSFKENTRTRKDLKHYKILENNSLGVPLRRLDDDSFTVLSTSQGIKGITGYSYSDFINNSIRSFKSIIDPAELEKICKKIDESIKKRAQYEISYKIINSDKTVHWVFERGRGVFNSRNKLLYLDSVLMDITVFISSQQELEKYKNHLEDMVEQKTEELNLSLKTLKHTQDKLIETEKMASLGMLVSGVAHEINTPLGIGITAISHLEETCNNLKQDIQAGSLKKRELFAYLDTSSQSIELTMSNLNRAADIVTRFKQISIDQYSEERKSFYLIEYAKIMLNNYLLEYRDIDISFELDYKEDFEIFTYQNALSDIFFHLISNSIQHGFKNRESGRVYINISADKETVTFLYRDNGCGIDEKNLKKIFEPFYTSNRSMGHSGLGMNIIYNLVTQMLNGVISCSSDNHEGFEVIINIPVSDTN